MRLHNRNDDTAFSTLAIFLTKTEASELQSALDSLLAHGSHHEHVMSEDYQKEITVAIYDATALGDFDQRTQRLIVEDR